MKLSETTFLGQHDYSDSNEVMNDFMKIVNSLEGAGVLMEGNSKTIRNKANK